MNKANLRLCTHTGFIYSILLAIGLFGLTGWLPPISPLMTAPEIAQMFEQKRTMIRLGATVMAMASVLWWPFTAAICMQLKKIEGDSHPLTYTQMALASGTVLGVILPAYLWLAAAYRPELDPNTLQLFNDMAWLIIIGMFPPGVLQFAVLGYCILQDKNPVKRYPRWLGYLNLWIAILSMSGALLPFFHDGPFTWRGLIGFWLVAVAFFTWIITMWWMTLRAIDIGEKLEPSK